jgi:PPOX class probable F420-dependent enzyme
MVTSVESGVARLTGPARSPFNPPSTGRELLRAARPNNPPIPGQRGAGGGDRRAYGAGVDPDSMRARLVAAPVGRLATVRSDGRPHLVPCCFAVVGETVFSAVDAKPKSTLALQRLTNIRNQPSVTVLVDHYAADWSTLWWVRVDGRAGIADGTDRTVALEALQAKYEQYRATPPPGPVIAITIESWHGWP